MLDSAVVTRWEKTGLIAMAACGLAVLAVVVLGKVPHAGTAASQPNAWNSRAIQGAFAGVRVREIDSAHAVVMFFYDLDNKTGADYQLGAGPNVVVMSRLSGSGSLSADQQLSLDSSVFVPAGNRTRIAVEINRPFNWPARKDAAAEAAFKQLVASQIAGIDGFVLFDQAARYQIDLPAAAPPAQ